MATATAYIGPAATYGRQDALNPDGTNTALRDEAWSHEQDNAAARGVSGSNAAYAQNAAQTGAGTQLGVQSRTLQNNEAGDRGYQNNAMGLAANMANGSMPSAGARQLQAGLVQGTHQQNAMAAGARGSAALATADANRSANTADLQQNAYTQGGILRAQEMAAGRGLYGSLATQQRDQDQNRIAQGNDLSQFNAQQSDRQSVGMAGIATGYGQLGANQANDSMAWNDIGTHATDAQFGMDQERQRWLQQANSSVAAQNQENH